MEFRVGDPVIHWTYGLGEIVSLEERTLSGQAGKYYGVRVQGLTVWVPADEKVMTRLRAPTPKREFKKLFAILQGPGESLPDDRFERKNQLKELLKDGNSEGICRVIRDLSTYQRTKTLNDDDKFLLKRASDSLLGEWRFSLSVPATQAEDELKRLLSGAD